MPILSDATSAAPAADFTAQFYVPEFMQKIRLEIKSEDLDRLNRVLPKRSVVPGTFRWKEETLPHVGVRWKALLTVPNRWLYCSHEFRPARIEGKVPG